ncbi:MAG: NADP-dependent isocitrate dehydrogenase, partial [Desulfovibrionaceae bacterium]|nr:NADP-dependent isocitrate dehydrogenase [Desulfovibrionaceae bacterium]
MAEAIKIAADGKVTTPDNPIIPFIAGDGIGPEIWEVAHDVFNHAIKQSASKRQVEWLPLAAGSACQEKTGKSLPCETLKAIQTYHVAIKGPLTTPVGSGMRSVNVELRRTLDLFACIRPVQYFYPVPSPVKHPELVDMVVFRENTEDVYCGLEWPVNSAESQEVISLVEKLTKGKIRPDSGIGIKPISEFGTKRLVRMAIQYALEQNRPSVTLVHKGNIMKYTEGAFRQWGYDLAKEEFGDVTVTEAELYEKYAGKMPEGKKLVIK